MKEKTNITVQDQAGNSSKTMLPAVPSRLSFDKALSGYLKGIEDWYKKNGASEDAF